mmetsp:Transcript_41423/g.125414  ORF Transcript_41423/g.125414 Transcript_41423/m.125414 type:complete len:144 (+) Transcript_41423:52-483(+)
MPSSPSTRGRGVAVHLPARRAGIVLSLNKRGGIDCVPAGAGGGHHPYPRQEGREWHCTCRRGGRIKGVKWQCTCLCGGQMSSWPSTRGRGVSACLPARGADIILALNERAGSGSAPVVTEGASREGSGSVPAGVGADSILALN